MLESKFTEAIIRPYQVIFLFLISLEPEIVSGRAQQKQTQAEKHKDFFVFQTGNDRHVMQFGGCK